MAQHDRTIGDLITAPAVKTVIQLKDLEDTQTLLSLARHFVFTEEVSRNIQLILEKVTEHRGQGFFLLGNYGSGKSHLLVTLSLVFDYPEVRQALAIQDQGLAGLVTEVGRSNYLLVTVPLQEHSNLESLEHVLLSRIADVLEKKWGVSLPLGLPAEANRLLSTTYRSDFEKYLREQGKTMSDFEAGQIPFVAENFVAENRLPIKSEYTRHLFIPKLQEILEQHSLGGVIVLIDELSEFLKSKLQARSFQEDIRFLQFLGEATQQFPLWLVSTMQERLEETGEIPQQLFRKIKDRYPIRLQLSGHHIRELIERYLIEKKPDSEPEIRSVFEELHRIFGKLPFDLETFEQLYPVHPVTIEYLDQLRPLFSQHRGVVDFIHHTIVGDPARQIASHLGNSLDWLLTPDLIFDHFRERIKETLEWNRYHDIVYQYYGDHIPRLFTSEQERVLALRIVKLLILACLLPTPRALSSEDLTLLLLQRITDLDPSVNFQFVQAIADRLVQEGAYLVYKTERGGRYTIDITHDLKVIVTRKLEAIKQELFPNDQRLFTQLVEDLNESYLPLGQYRFDEFYPHEVLWLNSQRKGMISQTTLTTSKEEWLEQLKALFNQEEQLVVFIFLSPLEPDLELDQLDQVFLPHLGKQADQILLWLPKKLEVTPRFLDILARRILWHRLVREQSTSRDKLLQHLKGLIEQDQIIVKEAFRTCYSEGDIIDGTGNVLYSVKELGLLPFPELLSRIHAEFFRTLFPKHNRIAALTEIYQRNRLDDLIQKFFNTGHIEFRSPNNLILRSLIEGYLKPMKVTKQYRQEILLDCDPNRSEVVRESMLVLAERPLDRKEWERYMKQSEYGLSDPQVELLLLALLFSGNVSGYVHQRKIEPSGLTVKQLEKINRLGSGDIISAAQQAVLRTAGILPEHLITKGFFSIIRQQEIWQWLCVYKDQLTLNIENVGAQLLTYQKDPSWRVIDFGSVQAALNPLTAVLESICVTLDSQKGLLRFIDFIQQNPLLQQQLENLSAVTRFFEQELTRWQEIIKYFHDFQKNRFLTAPETKYHELKTRFEQLQLDVGRTKFILDLGFREDILTRIQDFQAAYEHHYLQAHNEYHSIETVQSVNALVQSQTVKVLTLLAQLDFIPDLFSQSDLLQKMGDIKSTLCRAPVEKMLETSIWCRCDFQLGDKRSTFDLAATLKTLERATRQSFEAFQQSEIASTILEFSEDLEKIGHNELYGTIREILSLEVHDHKLIRKLGSLLTQDTISSLNKVFKGKMKIISKNIHEFLNPLLGKTLPARKIVDLFVEWLALENEDIFVRLEQHDFVQQGSLFRLHIQQDLPELQPFLDELGEEQLQLLVVFLAWLQRRMHPFELIYTLLPSLPAQLKPIVETAEQVLPHFHDILPQLIEEVDHRIMYKTDPMVWLHRFQDALSPSSLTNLLREEETFSFLIQAGLRQLICDLLQGHGTVDEDTLAEIQSSALIRKESVLLDSFSSLKQLHFLQQQQRDLRNLDFNQINSPRAWERVYTTLVAELPYRLATVQEWLKQQGLSEYQDFLKQEECFQVLATLEERFERFYVENHQTVGLKLETLLIKKIPSLLKKYPHSRITYLLIDGLRYDLWTVLGQEILAQDKTMLRPIEQFILWATLPTTTETQLQALLEKPFSFLHYTAHEQPLQTQQELEFSGGTIYKINTIDTKIHTTRDPLPTLFQEILFHLKHTLEPLLRGLQRGDLILIFSDHGFRTNPDFLESDKYRTTRYNHGGNSLFEVLVPATLYYRM